MRIVVIGGTGRIGSKVVARLQEQGHEAVAAAPSTGVDILSGDGVAAAIAGTDVVVDLSNSPSFEDEAVMSFFRTAGNNLLDAEREAGVGHHVALSVVGTGKLPDSGYFRAKAVQEQLIRDSGVPYTIIHSTQFFEFLPQIIQSGAADGTVRVPQALVQPIAAEEVAEAVARRALEAPANGIVEIAGPEAAPIVDMARRFMERTDDARTLVGDVHARYFGAELANDSLVPAPTAWRGSIDFERWIDAANPAPADRPRTA